MPQFSIPDGYEVDLARDGSSDPDAGKKGGGAGYRIDVNNNKVEKSPLGDTVTMTWDVVSDHATLNVECLEVIYYRLPTAVQKWTGAVDVAATIFLKKRQGATVEYTDQLLLTARAVCSCEGPPIDDRIEHLSVVHERILTGRESLGNRERLEMTIRDANQYSANIRHEMMQSITSSDRYPRGAVSLLDTQLFANTLGMHLETADRAINPRLSSWAGDAEDLARRVARYAPRMTRSGALQISLPDQVQRFGLSFDEALTLRRALADLPAPQGRPPEPEDHAITVPQLSGRYVDEARTTIIDLDLDVGSIVESDNQLATGMVIAQDPPAGTEVDPGTEVHLTTSTGLSVILPNVVALPLADAMCALLAAGLRADPTVTGPTGPETRVAESEPQVGTPITPNASVTLRLRAGGSAMKDAGLLL